MGDAVIITLINVHSIKFLLTLTLYTSISISLNTHQRRFFFFSVMMINTENHKINVQRTRGCELLSPK